MPRLINNNKNNLTRSRSSPELSETDDALFERSLEELYLLRKQADSQSELLTLLYSRIRENERKIKNLMTMSQIIDRHIGSKKLHKKLDVFYES